MNSLYTGTEVNKFGCLGYTWYLADDMIFFYWAQPILFFFVK